MGMTIEEAISWLLSIAEHEGGNIPIYDTDVEAIKMGIETMRKYQKIKQIANDKNINGDLLRMSEIRWVLENGNDD